jgi:DNA mismatch endonuclease (patch repair protein)
VAPKNRNEYWDEKLTQNVLRDERQTLGLKRDGWIVLRYWEHAIRASVRAVVMEITREVRVRRERCKVLKRGNRANSSRDP